MKITEFTQLLTEYEGNKKGVSIAQMAEVVKVINLVTDGMLYKYVKNCDEAKTKSMLASKKAAPAPAKKIVALAKEMVKNKANSAATSVKKTAKKQATNAKAKKPNKKA